MRTQITKPSVGKARYTQEYKQQALELWRQSGRSAAKVGAELGIRPSLLYEWAKLSRKADVLVGLPAQSKAPKVEELQAQSREGNCYDNAFIESFWSSLKYETVYHQRFATRAEARCAIFDYIESFYNRTRLHSALGHQSPVSFELKHN
jgi:transposase-like protein